MRRTGAVLLAVALLGFGGLGCRQDGPAEKAGNPVDEGTEPATGATRNPMDYSREAAQQLSGQDQDKIAEAVNDSKHAVEEAGQKTQDAVTDAVRSTKQGVEDAGQKTEDAVKGAVQGTKDAVEGASRSAESKLE